jgi:hypothetical protein
MSVRCRCAWFSVVLLPAFALASTVVAMDVPTVTKAADVVVLGVVRQSVPRWTRDRTRIITDTEIEVAETWKGASRARIVVMQPGGVVGDVGQKVEGVATFAEGERVVLFLEARGAPKKYCRSLKRSVW